MPIQNTNRPGKKVLYELQTTEMLPVPSVLSRSICKTNAHYLGVCNSNARFLETKWRPLRQECRVVFIFKQERVLNQENDVPIVGKMTEQ